MAYMDKGMFCPLSEYEKHESLRVIESEMNPGDLYTVMFRLHGEKLQAAKLPARAMGITKEAGLVAVKFAFLDYKLDPQKIVDTTVVDGFVDDFSPEMVIGRVGNKEAVKIHKAYCRDYFDGMYGYMEESSRALLASA